MELGHCVKIEFIIGICLGMNGSKAYGPTGEKDRAKCSREGLLVRKRAVVPFPLDCEGVCRW